MCAANTKKQYRIERQLKGNEYNVFEHDHTYANPYTHFSIQQTHDLCSSSYNLWPHTHCLCAKDDQWLTHHLIDSKLPSSSALLTCVKSSYFQFTLAMASQLVVQNKSYSGKCGEKISGVRMQFMPGENNWACFKEGDDVKFNLWIWETT